MLNNMIFLISILHFFSFNRINKYSPLNFDMEMEIEMFPFSNFA